MICLDDLVPADDDLRRIDALIDWEHVRATARPFYRPGGAGRLGTDPAVLVKLALVLAWRGLPSMRSVLKTAQTDMSIRWFLGFGLSSRTEFLAADVADLASVKNIGRTRLARLRAVIARERTLS